MRLALLLLLAWGAQAQMFTYRGYVDTRIALFPETAPNDSSHAILDTILRYETATKLTPWLRVNADFNGRFDSHRQTERSARLDFEDRRALRPALSVRRLSVRVNRGPWLVEIGRQFIRWGKADILNPTDRFAPRDFLSVVDTDFLAVPAARVTWERGSNSVDAIWQVRFTPSRLPLFNQRWVVLPAEAANVPIVTQPPIYPGGSQFGLRWNHTGSAVEYSLSVFDGYNHLPLLSAAAALVRPATLGVAVQRYYARIRTYGADVAVPNRWFVLKAEAAYFTTKTSTADEYLQYVIQAERTSGEWSFVGGYAGEYVTDKRTTFDFAPDRGLTKAFLGRAAYTIDARRSVSLQTAVRQNAAGAWVQAEYTQLFGSHWRGVAGFALIRGKQTDFLGQYRRNSHGILGVRYSF